ncbi:MAG: hypothetical protein ACYCVB_08065 [Bacilli bacterium]
MWELMQNATRGLGRPGRRQSTMGALPTLLLGAGVGIATWEIVRRRTGAGFGQMNAPAPFRTE